MNGEMPPDPPRGPPHDEEEEHEKEKPTEQQLADRVVKNLRELANRQAQDQGQSSKGGQDAQMEDDDEFPEIDPAILKAAEPKDPSALNSGGHNKESGLGVPGHKAPKSESSESDSEELTDNEQQILNLGGNTRPPPGASNPYVESHKANSKARRGDDSFFAPGYQNAARNAAQDLAQAQAMSQQPAAVNNATAPVPNASPAFTPGMAGPQAQATASLYNPTPAAPPNPMAFTPGPTSPLYLPPGPPRLPVRPLSPSRGRGRGNSLHATSNPPIPGPPQGPGRGGSFNGSSNGFNFTPVLSQTNSFGTNFGSFVLPPNMFGTTAPPQPVAPPQPLEAPTAPTRERPMALMRRTGRLPPAPSAQPPVSMSSGGNASSFPSSNVGQIPGLNSLQQTPSGQNVQGASHPLPQNFGAPSSSALLNGSGSASQQLNTTAGSSTSGFQPQQLIHGPYGHMPGISRMPPPPDNASAGTSTSVYPDPEKHAMAPSTSAATPSVAPPPIPQLPQAELDELTAILNSSSSDEAPAPAPSGLPEYDPALFDDFPAAVSNASQNANVDVEDVNNRASTDAVPQAQAPAESFTSTPVRKIEKLVFFSGKERAAANATSAQDDVDMTETTPGPAPSNDVGVQQSTAPAPTINFNPPPAPSNQQVPSHMPAAPVEATVPPAEDDLEMSEAPPQDPANLDYGHAQGLNQLSGVSSNVSQQNSTMSDNGDIYGASPRGSPVARRAIQQQPPTFALNSAGRPMDGLEAFFHTQSAAQNCETGNLHSHSEAPSTNGFVDTSAHNYDPVPATQLTSASRNEAPTAAAAANDVVDESAATGAPMPTQIAQMPTYPTALPQREVPNSQSQSSRADLVATEPDSEVLQTHVAHRILEIARIYADRVEFTYSENENGLDIFERLVLHTAQLQQSHTEHQTEIRVLTSRTGSLESRINQLVADVQVSNIDSAELGAALEKMRNELHHAQARALQNPNGGGIPVSPSNIPLNAQLATVQGELKHEKRLGEDKDNKIAELKRQISSMKTQLAEMHDCKKCPEYRDLAEKNDQLAKQLQSKLAEREGQLEKAESKNGSATADVFELASVIDDQACELAKLRSENARLKAEVADKDRKLEDKDRKLEDMTVAHDIAITDKGLALADAWADADNWKLKHRSATAKLSFKSRGLAPQQQSDHRREHALESLREKAPRTPIQKRLDAIAHRDPPKPLDTILNELFLGGSDIFPPASVTSPQISSNSDTAVADTSMEIVLHPTSTVSALAEANTCRALVLHPSASVRGLTSRRSAGSSRRLAIASGSLKFLGYVAGLEAAAMPLPSLAAAPLTSAETRTDMPLSSSCSDSSTRTSDSALVLDVQALAASVPLPRGKPITSCFAQYGPSTRVLAAHARMSQTSKQDFKHWATRRNSLLAPPQPIWPRHKGGHKHPTRSDQADRVLRNWKPFKAILRRSRSKEMGDIPLDADLVQLRNEPRPGPECRVYNVHFVDYSKVSIDGDYVEDDQLEDRRFPRFAKEQVATNDDEVFDHLDTHDCAQHEERFGTTASNLQSPTPRIEVESHHQPSLPIDHGFSSVVPQDRSYTGRRGRSSRYDGGLYIEGPNMTIEREESNSTDRSLEASSQPALDSNSQVIEEDGDLPDIDLVPTNAETADVDAPLPPEPSADLRATEDAASLVGSNSPAPDLHATSQVTESIVETPPVAGNADVSVETPNAQATELVETPAEDNAAFPAESGDVPGSQTTDQPHVGNQASSPQPLWPTRIFTNARRNQKRVNNLCSSPSFIMLIGVLITVCSVGAFFSFFFWYPPPAPSCIPCINAPHPLFVGPPAQPVCYLSDFQDRMNMGYEPRILDTCLDHIANLTAITQVTCPPCVAQPHISLNVVSGCDQDEDEVISLAEAAFYEGTSAGKRSALQAIDQTRSITQCEKSALETMVGQLWNEVVTPPHSPAQPNPPVVDGANDGWLPDLIFWGPIFGFRYWISSVGR